MPTYFTITSLDGGYSWKDFAIEENAYDYCTDVLDIPEEAIDYLEILDDSLEISLFEDTELVDEDWYAQLISIAKISEVTAS